MIDATAAFEDSTADTWWRRAAAGLGIVAVTVIAAFVAGRNLWFFSDDWNIIAGYPSGHLLEPFNSHLSLVPVGVYQGLFHTVGLGSYVPFRVVGLVAYGILGWVTWRFARERLGALGAALATTAVLWNSGGVTNVMFPFLMNFSLPVAAVAAIWWHLDRRTTRHDIAASAWLVMALATSGLGLMTTVAVAVELAWRAVAARRIDWGRWLILAPGPVLWFAWYLRYGVDSPASGGVRPIVSYSVRMLWGGFASLAGGNKWLGFVVIAGFVALLVATAVQRSADARLAGALAAPLVFAVLTAVSRIGVVPAIPPDELRYRWTIGAFVVLATVIMLGSVRNHRGPTWSTLARPIAVVAAISVVAGAIVLAGDVADWNRSVERAVPGVRSNLWVAEQAHRAGVLDRGRALPVSYVKVTAGEYADAVAELGSPLEGLPASAFGGTADSRRAADEAFVHDFAVTVVPDSPAAGCRPAPVMSPLTVHSGEVYEVSAMADAVGVRFALFASDANAVVIGRLEAGEKGFVTIPDLGRAAPGRARLVADHQAGINLCA